jgi:hypothetical protein
MIAITLVIACSGSSNPDSHRLDNAITDTGTIADTLVLDSSTTSTPSTTGDTGDTGDLDTTSAPDHKFVSHRALPARPRRAGTTRSVAAP